jgi:hypothetical protein
MPLKKSVSYEGLMGDAFGKYGEKKKKKYSAVKCHN